MLLLDEPAAGMNPQETLELRELVLMSLSDRIYVMEYGSRIAVGTPREVRENPKVIKAYLGEADHA